MFVKRDKQDPNRSGQTSVDTAGIDFTKPVIKIKYLLPWHIQDKNSSFCLSIFSIRDGGEWDIIIYHHIEAYQQ